MRSFAWFVATLVVAGLAAAAIAYPVFELTSHIASWPFHRVSGRIAMLTAVAGLVWLCRHLNLTTKRDLGYGLPWRRFLRVAALWCLAGIATASIGAAFLVGGGLRIITDPALASAGHAARLLWIGLSSGLAVALIEETVMRGAMHTAIARESGNLSAALLTAPLFAVLHFFAKAHIDSPGWTSGFDLLARSFSPLADFGTVLDSFLAWLAVSLVLSMTRILTGNIATAIGLHAGWVVVLRILQESTGTGATHSVWVGRFDGLLGYWVIPWSAAIGLTLWLTRRAWAPYAAGGDVSGASEASRSSRSSGSPISR
jgi:membrane protease YdiL (CAAX protease family)